ncbi:MAG TPA: hypothetical protein HA362_05860 [Nanoarchaeota archaeon]|nr:hypothetical protein [Nanoarchaeota archaeon]
MPSVLEFIKSKFSFRGDLSARIDRVEALEKSVQQSFTNLRKDMEHVSKLLHYFKATDEKYAKQISMILRRLDHMDYNLGKSSGKLAENEEQEEAAEVASSIEQEDDALWESLTETQQKLCWKLAALQKEMPGQWISLKYLAQELYPDREYGLVRSTLSQFVSALEEMGFVKRKRKGKQAYIVSTDMNPCLKRKMPIAEVEKVRVKK